MPKEIPIEPKSEELLHFLNELPLFKSLKGYYVSPANGTKADGFDYSGEKPHDAGSLIRQRICYSF
jgi:hypothetical protein